MGAAAALCCTCSCCALHNVAASRHNSKACKSSRPSNGKLHRNHVTRQTSHVTRHTRAAQRQHFTWLPESKAMLCSSIAAAAFLLPSLRACSRSV